VPRSVAALMEGNVIERKFLQVEKMLDKVLHEFNVVGKVTDLRFTQLLKQLLKVVIPVEFEGSVISNKALQF
jgi:hypothetical protein